MMWMESEANGKCHCAIRT